MGGMRGLGLSPTTPIWNVGCEDEASHNATSCAHLGGVLICSVSRDFVGSEVEGCVYGTHLLACPWMQEKWQALPIEEAIIKREEGTIARDELES